MAFEKRLPEGREVNKKTVKLFSRIAALGALPAAWRVKMILGEKIGASAHVLDIGTGPGTIPLHLKRFFPEASFTGLDVSPDMLSEAMKHNRRQGKVINLLAGDGTLLPFADNSLDGVVSFFLPCTILICRRLSLRKLIGSSSPMVFFCLLIFEEICSLCFTA